jgi:hypothetical protein
VLSRYLNLFGSGSAGLGLLPFALAHLLSALVLSATATGILVLVAACESVALRKPIVAISPARE